MNYIKSDEKVIFDWLRGHLDEERLLHSIGTARCAAELAAKYSIDDEKAYIAGLLHDCAKCFDEKELLKIAKNLPLENGEDESCKILHAPVSAYIAEKEFGIKDADILSSIRWHTLGHLNMSLFDKVVFLADKIEPLTRDLAFRDIALNLLEGNDGLNRALLLCYKETIKSLLRRDFKICQTTIDIYNSLL